VTLPGFVERRVVIASMPSLGLLTLAERTPREYDVTYLECPEFDAAVLGQYSFRSLASARSRPGRRHVPPSRTISARAASRSCWVGLSLHARPGGGGCARRCRRVGEGEAPLASRARRLEAGLAPAHVSQTDPSRDVDLATPRSPGMTARCHALQRNADQTARGCHLDCEFCAASKISGAYNGSRLQRGAGAPGDQGSDPASLRRAGGRQTHSWTNGGPASSCGPSRGGVHLVHRDDISLATIPSCWISWRERVPQVLIAWSRRERIARGSKPTTESPTASPYQKAIDEIQRRGILRQRVLHRGAITTRRTSFRKIERFVKRSGS